MSNKKELAEQIVASTAEINTLFESAANLGLYIDVSASSLQMKAEPIAHLVVNVFERLTLMPGK